MKHDLCIFSEIGKFFKNEDSNSAMYAITNCIKALSLNFSRKIDPEHKYTFKFLSDNVPNVRALYHIGGKDYICSKLTTTFNEFGRSQLIKGEFYRVL